VLAVSVSDIDPVGLVGRLLIATRGSAGPGEVSVAIRGGRECFIAYSDDPLPVEQTVLVIESGPGRGVTVVPWTDPLV
jgi:hypothetical protein